jgi:RNA polymerase sigma factor (sigma-70 family)
MTSPRLTGLLRYVHHLVIPEDSGDPSDGQLLQKFVAQRDEGAFAELLQRHGPLVLAVCRQVLCDAHAAEDAFQATFLVLARKAASIRRKASLAAWLYRVALNVARTAMARDARRRTREREAGTMSQAHSISVPALADWQPLLHEEVSRLPEKYRVPIVLCYLQGKTHDAAARELDWPVGTVKGRLARARDLLRTRLTRRGLSLSAGLLATTLDSESATAAVPATLLNSTLQAAVRFAAGQTIGGAASTQAIFLAKGALQIMAASKVTTVAVCLLIAGVVGTVGGVLAFHTQGEGGPGGQSEPSPAGQERREPPLLMAAVHAPLQGVATDKRSVAMPTDQMRVHRIEQSETDKSSGGAVVVEGPPANGKPPGEQLKVLKALFNDAARAGGQGKSKVKAGSNLNALAIGPMLFPPDKVAVRSFVRRADLLELEILYTHDRSHNSYSREDRKHPWHPMVQLPVDLPPGRYQLAVTWRQVASLPDGKSLDQGAVHVFDFAVKPQDNVFPERQDQPTKRFRHGSSVSSVVYFPDGKTLAAGGHIGRIGEAEEAFGIVHMWDTATGKELAKFQTHGVAHVAVSRDGKTLAFAGTADGMILLWSVAAQNWIRQVNGRRGWGGNLPLAFSPDGKTLAAGGSWSVGICDIVTGKVVWHDVPEREPVYKLAFSPDGGTLAYSCVDLAPLRLMEVATWKERSQFQGLDRNVKIAAFSPDGATVALQQPDHSIRLCGLASGKELRRFKGHRAEITTLAFSPDGKTLASAGVDETIRFWEVATGKERGQFRSDQGKITALTWKPDGKSVASGGADGTVRVWNIVDAVPP